jgi:predicted metal-dependent phosphoesterase TrpH
MNKFDLHIYSEYSSFSINKIEDIIKNCIKNKIKGFAITDLGTIKAWAPITKLAKENDLIFVPGQEINLTYAGKNIGKATSLFSLDKINSTDLFQVLDEIKSQGALLSISHPFDLTRMFSGFKYLLKHRPLSKKLRCIETFNSRVTFANANLKAQLFAKEHDLIQSAGSEAHLPQEIGMGYVISKASSESELLKELKLKNTAVGGKLVTLGRRLYSLIDKN